MNLRLRRKMNEVFSVEANDLGFSFLTNYFRKITAYLKVTPFIYVIPLTIVISIFLYFVLGGLLIKLVSFLQYGF